MLTMLAFELFPVALCPPFPIWHNARELFGQVDAGFLPNSETMGHVLDDVAVAVGAFSRFEEVGIGGNLQRFNQVARAIVGVAGVAELLFARLRCTIQLQDLRSG